MSKVPQEAIEVAVVQAGKHLAVKLSEVYRAAGQKPADCQAIRDWMIAIKAADAARAQGMEVEPVAWLIEHPTNPREGKDLSFADLTKADRKAGFTSKPLYTTQPVQTQGAEVEPIAWASQVNLKRTSMGKTGMMFGTRNNSTPFPLYTAPPAPQPADREKVLEEALKFYADPKNWIDTPPWNDGGDDPDTITPKAIPVSPEEGSPCDCGDIARAALAGGEA